MDQKTKDDAAVYKITAMTSYAIICCFADNIPEKSIEEIIQGGIANEAGVIIAGGHTINDPDACSYLSKKLGQVITKPLAEY